MACDQHPDRSSLATLNRHGRIVLSHATSNDLLSVGDVGRCVGRLVLSLGSRGVDKMVWRGSIACRGRPDEDEKPAAAVSRRRALVALDVRV